MSLLLEAILRVFLSYLSVDQCIIIVLEKSGQLSMLIWPKGLEITWEGVSH